MPGMVTSIVEALKYLTPMAFDVMIHAVLAQLASPKKKLKVRAAGRVGLEGGESMTRAGPGGAWGRGPGRPAGAKGAGSATGSPA